MNYTNQGLVTRNFLYRDLETRSLCSIDCGAHKYAADPSTTVLCVCFAVNDGPIKTWFPGDPIPEEFIQAATGDDWLIIAHNDSFETAIEQHVLARIGWPQVPLERHRCTMAMARACALPGKLSNLAAALGLEVRKDEDGAKLMKRLCKGTSPAPTAEELQRLAQYCAIDVEVTRQAYAALPPLSDAEQALWVLDQQINNRGFHADRRLAEAVNELAPAEKAAIDAKLAEVTNGEVTSASQVARILDYARDRGSSMEALGKRNVASVLTHTSNDEVRTVLELRKRGGKASATSKAAALLARIDSDNRARGCFMFHMAATGRWAGAGFQPQNLPKPSGIDLEAACAALLSRDVERVRAIGEPLQVASDISRCLITAAPGHVLIGADFAAIEARMLAWLATETWKLELFRKFDAGLDPTSDVYCATASRILGRLVTKDDKVGRTVGKTAELACGFSGWVGAWKRFAPDDKRDDDAIAADVIAWRDAHPNITAFWNALERTLIAAVRTPGKEFRCGKLSAEATVDGAMLWLRLPSGRRLGYPEPGIVAGKREGSVAIEFKDNAGGKWKDVVGWRGTYAENVTQAVSRDLLSAAMLRLEAAGYRIVTHCHDEAVAEVDAAFGSVDEFVSIMCALPDWAAGLPVAAEGWRRACYAEKEAAEHHGGLKAAFEVDTAGGTPDNIPETQHKPNCNVFYTADETDCDTECPFDHDDASRKILERAAAHNRELRPAAPKTESISAGGSQDEPTKGTAALDRRHVYQDAAGHEHTRHDIYKLADGKKAGPVYHKPNGSWVKGRPATIIPYRLPELLQAPASELVCVTEGEKDADTLAALGFVATTQPLGAGKWDAGLNVHFQGRERVAIFEDHDDAGRANTRVVYEALRGVVATIAAPIAFPEVQAKGADVSDWVAQMRGAGVGDDALRTLLRGRIAEAFRSSQDTAVAHHEPLLWHGEPDPRPRQKWRLKPLIPRVGTGLLSGQWGTYKTFTAINLATTIIAAGQTFCGAEVAEQCGVLILATEGGFDLRDRIDAAVRERWPGMVNAPIAWRETCPILLADGAVDKLNAIVAEASGGCQERFGFPVGLVIIDVLADCAGYAKAGDENDPSIASRVMGTMRRVAEANQCFALAVDHFGKSQEAGTRGSSAKEAAADVVLACLGEKEVSGSVSNTRLALRKVRGGPQGKEYPYRPRVVQIVRPDGAQVDDFASDSTLVIDWESGSTRRQTFDDPWEALVHETRQASTKIALRVFRRALTRAMGAHGEDKTTQDGEVVRMVNQAHVREEFNELAVADGDVQQQKETKRKQFARTLERLVNHELVGQLNAGDETYLWGAGA
jgi:DNA polymerase bacteriophage-type